MHRVKATEGPGLVMDIRMTNQELVAVTEAVTGSIYKDAKMLVMDTRDASIKDHIEVSEANINCCDVADGLIAVGGDDFKVRLFWRPGSMTHSSSCSSNQGCQSQNGGYVLGESILCSDPVNDLRLAEDSIVALKTVKSRQPVGVDVIQLGHPDQRRSIHGGSVESGGKFLHALDCFEGCCSLSSIVCTGEHPETSFFSAMLFDFRRSRSCVMDVPVTENDFGTLLWPLRTGRFPQVYANLLREGVTNRGEITMVDFRYPSLKLSVHCPLPNPVEDFRCLEGSIYAVTSDTELGQSRLQLHRFDPDAGITECLCTVVEAYDARGRTSREDLKVFSICPQGFALAYGGEFALGNVTRPRRWF